MKLLADNGLRPLTYREALARSSDLIDECKGRGFWLGGEAPKRMRYCTWNVNGELIKLTGKESLDQKVRFFPGNHPLALDVCSDGDTDILGRRFTLSSDGDPQRFGSVVIGIADEVAILGKGREALARLKRNLPE